jgi:hypothetical protein
VNIGAADGPQGERHGWRESFPAFTIFYNSASLNRAAYPTGIKRTGPLPGCCRSDASLETHVNIGA